MVEYYCKNCDLKTDLSECPNCHERTDLKSSSVFWCDQCNIPLYNKICPLCGSTAKRVASDLRPVFPEERLLMEIVLGEPLKYLQSSVVQLSARIIHPVEESKFDGSLSWAESLST